MSASGPNNTNCSSAAYTAHITVTGSPATTISTACATYISSLGTTVCAARTAATTAISASSAARTFT